MAPSGRQVSVRCGGYAATVTEVGATLRSLSYDGRPLLHGFDLDQMAAAGAGQLLLPWPNRIEDGQYEFQGRSHQLALSEPPPKHNAMHGLVRWLPWQLRPSGGDQVTATLVLHPQPGYPFTLALSVTYAVGDDGLRVRVRATNSGAELAPYGHGMHPYLIGGEGVVDDWDLTIPATAVCRVDERGLPEPAEPVADTRYDFGSPRRIGEIRLDNPFTGLSRDETGRATVRVRDATAGSTVELWMDRSYRWVQAFTGDTLPPDRARRAVALEPMTCPPNAFRSGTDLVRLDPGASHLAEWGVRAR